MITDRPLSSCPTTGYCIPMPDLIFMEWMVVSRILASSRFSPLIRAQSNDSFSLWSFAEQERYPVSFRTRSTTRAIPYSYGNRELYSDIEIPRLHLWSRWFWYYVCWPVSETYWDFPQYVGVQGQLGIVSRINVERCRIEFAGIHPRQKFLYLSSIVTARGTCKHYK